MSGRRRAAAVVALLAFLLPGGAPRAAHADSAQADATTVLVGEQFTLVLEVETPPGAAVDVDPVGAGWNGVEVVGVIATTAVPRAGGVLHRLELTAAAFAPGRESFVPTVVVVDADGEARVRELPAVSLVVAPSLAAGAPLELSPLPEPGRTGGGESPLLRPAIAAGGGATLLVLALIGFVAARAAARRVRRRAAEDDAPGLEPPDLDQAEHLLDVDPVRAYRMLGQMVRAEVGRRFDLPAPALTTGEIGRRMEAVGVDRWAARLVAGLLQECDAVVYAGYRPAAERRQADLNMAREILEVGGA